MNQKKGFLIGATLVGVLLAVGVIYSSMVGPLPAHVETGNRVDPMNDTRMARSGGEVVDVPKTVTILLPKEENGNVTYERVAAPLPEGEQPFAVAMKALVDRADVFPKGTRVLSASVDNRLATVNFSSEITSGMGSTQEQAVLGSIVRTAGQFFTVTNVRILVDGKEVDSLGGHLETTEPLAVVR